MSNIAVVGAGSWGTALALLLCRRGHAVRLWGHHRRHVECLRKERENRRYLPGLRFPEALSMEPDLATAVAQVDLTLVAVPSHAYGATLIQLAPHLAPGLEWLGPPRVWSPAAVAFCMK